MVSESEYVEWDAVEMARRVARRDVGPEELLEVAIRRAERLNPALGAITGKLYDRARAQIARGFAADAPLAGVPFFVKDQLEFEGELMRMGSGILRDNRAPFTHPVAERLERAGLVIAAQTNLSEIGFLPFSEPDAYPATHNPWNADYTAGGSSGGSGAAVAARMVPAAHAMDGGGSIRVPASCCGLFGLKPTRGRNPASPIDDVDGFVAHHVVSISVRDSAAILDVTQGATPLTRNPLPKAENPFRDALLRDPKPLRIGYSLRGADGQPLHADCKVAIETSVSQLRALGHTVVEARPQINMDTFAAGFRVLWAMGAGYFLKSVCRELERKNVPSTLARAFTKPQTLKRIASLSARLGKPLIEPWTFRLAELDATHTPGDLWLAWNDMRATEHAVLQFFEDYDLFLSTTLGEPPRKLGGFDATRTLDAMQVDLLHYANYCPIANACGFPAMSVPLQMSRAGLPIGLHFLGPKGDEAGLFALAAQLERAYPWAKRIPQIATPK